MNDCQQVRRAPLTNVDVRIEPFAISREFKPNYLYLLHLQRLGRSLAGIGLRAREHQGTYVRTFIFDNLHYRPSVLRHRAGASLPTWRCGEAGQDAQRAEKRADEESTVGGRAIGLEILFDQPVTPESDSFWVGFQLTQPTELVVCHGWPYIGLVSTEPVQVSDCLDSFDVIDVDPALLRPQIQLFYTA